MFNLDATIQKLLDHPYFEKAKHVKELGPGHPEDSVFTHLTQTSDVVRQKLDGTFIQNPVARKLFLDFVNKDFDGNTQGEIAVITGLVHDIGKILSYKEEGNIFPINQVVPFKTSTRSIDHGYYGSIIIKPLLQDLGLEEKVTNYIAEVVRLHLIPFDYYQLTTGYSITQAIDALKPQMQGFHIEVCLNAIGDINSNPPLEKCKQLLYSMFEEPHFYSTREYFVP